MSAPRVTYPGTATGGVPVGGSGTTDQLAKWIGTTTIGDSSTSQVVGAVNAYAITNPGAGYTPGSYTAVAMVGGTGTGAVANIVVSGAGVVTSCTVIPGNGGKNYTVGDALTAPALPGGAGFTASVAETALETVTDAGAFVNRMRLSATAGHNRIFSWSTGKSPRWAMRVDNTAESGSNAGSDWQLRRYTDAGVVIDSVLRASRAGGQAWTGNNFGVAGDPGAGLAIASLTNLGAAATNGTYWQAALTGGGGTGATADVVVSGGVVTSLVLRNPGQGYAVGDNLACASIGAAGNVATVATVTNYAGVTGDLYATRIGAGTTRPVSTGHVSGLLSVTGHDWYAPKHPLVNFAPSRWRSSLYVQGDASTGLFPIQDADVFPSLQYNNANFDFSSRSTGVSVYGSFITAVAAVPPSGTPTMSVAGLRSDASLYGAFTGKTVNLFGVQSFVNAGVDVSGANTISNARAFSAHVFFSASSAQSISQIALFSGANTSIGGAAHTVASYYGLRLTAPSLTNGATITNRWGVSQEDTAAKNQFLGNVGIGVDPGAGKILASLTLTNGGAGYTNGTYSQVALTTVTGSGSGATADIVVAGGVVTTVVLRAPGQGYAVGDTLSCASIGAGAGFLVTVSTTASILQSDGTAVAPRIGAGTSAPRNALDVPSGGAIFQSPTNFVLNNGPFANVLAQYAVVIGGLSTNAVATQASAASLRTVEKWDVTGVTNPNIVGAHFTNRLAVSTAGQTVTFYGVNAGTTRDYSSGDNATAVSLFGVWSTAQVNQTSGSTAQLAGVASNTPNFQAGHTITEIDGFIHRGLTQAGTVTNFYGIRLQAPTGAGTITNRYGVFVEDALAKSIFASQFTDQSNYRGLQLFNATYSGAEYETITAIGIGASAASNIGIVLQPKGTGAISANMPDGAATGGNARGNYAVDLQLVRSAANMVASGVSSFAVGQDNRPSSDFSVAIGFQNVCSGTYGVALGRGNTAGTYGVALGQSCTASGTNAVAIGLSTLASGAQSAAFNSSSRATATAAFASGVGSLAALRGQQSHQAQTFTTFGDAQKSLLVPLVQTTGNAATNLTLDSAALAAGNALSLPNNTAWAVDLHVVGRSATGADHAYFVRRALIRRNANAAATALVGTVQTIGTDIGSNAGAPPAGWAVAVTADTVNGALDVKVTGAAATTINWVARVELVEVGLA